MATSIKTAILNLPNFDKGQNTMTRFVTSIKYTASVAKMVNNLTFLQDPNWDMTANGETTLPLSFFFVQKWSEEMQSEVSQKPMLFYNSQGTGTETTNGALLDIVADNIITKPKTYKLDVLVPFTPDACLDQFQLDHDTLSNALIFATTYGNKAGNVVNDIAGGLSVYNRVVSNSIGILRLLFTALSVDLNVSSIVSALLEQNDINKRSLEAMRDNRGIVRMKMWNGWKFKYLVISSLDLTKSGEYDGFYEGTITLQELPVMSIDKSKNSFTSFGKSVMYSHFAKARALYLKGAQEKAEGAMTEATGG